MFGALKRGFRSISSLILVRNAVGELQPKRTLAASRGFLAAARLSCCHCKRFFYTFYIFFDTLLLILYLIRGYTIIVSSRRLNSTKSCMLLVVQCLLDKATAVRLRRRVMLLLKVYPISMSIDNF